MIEDSFLFYLIFYFEMSNKNKKIVKGTSANHGDSKASVQSDKLINSSSIMNMSKQLLFPPGAGPSEFNVDTWRLYLLRTIASNTILAPFISIFSSKDGKYSTIRHLPDEPLLMIWMNLTNHQTFDSSSEVTMM